jgi:hypothetical protein
MWLAAEKREAHPYELSFELQAQSASEKAGVTAGSRVFSTAEL